MQTTVYFSFEDDTNEALHFGVDTKLARGGKLNGSDSLGPTCRLTFTS